MTATLTICATCKFSDGEKVRDGRTAGELFGDHVIEAAAETGVTVRRHPCLMGCDHPCNVALQAPGKLAYVLGGFDPNSEDAAALVAFAEKFGLSETGQVPFREWPQGVKGHFISRTPPLPDD